MENHSNQEAWKVELACNEELDDLDQDQKANLGRDEQQKNSVVALISH